MKPGVKIRLDFLLLLGILLLLAITRFAGLSTRPLTDPEALHALDAAASAQVSSEFWPSIGLVTPKSPLYHLPTQLLFQLFGAGDATARLVPAAAGFVLLLLVVLLWKADQPRIRLLWLLLLGLSPVVLTISRTADGDILAATAVFAVFLILLHGDHHESFRPDIVVAIAAGFALTAGDAVFKACTGIAFAALISLAIQPAEKERWGFLSPLKGLRQSAWLLPVTAFLILTGLGSSVEGLRGFASALQDWLLGWVQPSGYNVPELFLLLVTSEPLILLFGLIGAVRLWAKREITGQWVACWVAGAAIFIVLFRGRTPADLIWLILPLSYLAARAILELLESLGEMSSTQELIGLIALLVVFAASGALSLVAYGTGNVLTVDPGSPNLVLLLFFALGIMGLSVLVFFGIGWSWSIVIQAVGILFAILALSQSISTIGRLNFSQDGYQVTDLWWQIAPADGLPLMIRSLENTAFAYAGQRENLPIEVQGDLPASAAWALRDFQKAEAGMAFGQDAAPVVLTPQSGTETSLAADYIGQSLGVRERRAWESVLPPDLFRWWISRTGPTLVERWVLWVRVDVASFGELGIDG